MNERTWTPLELVKTTAEYLAGKGIPTPRLDAEVLMAKLLDCTRVQLYTQFDRPLAAADVDRYRGWIRRRLGREPVSRILGVREFMGIPITINEHVLSPRPETEILVEQALAILHPERRNRRRRSELRAEANPPAPAPQPALQHAPPATAGDGWDDEARTEAIQIPEALAAVAADDEATREFSRADPNAPDLLDLDAPAPRDPERAPTTPLAADDASWGALDDGADGWGDDATTETTTVDETTTVGEPRRPEYAPDTDSRPTIPGAELVGTETCPSAGSGFGGPLYKVLELGVGSGCIAVSIAKYAPRAHVVAGEVHAPALLVARHNAVANEVWERVDLREGDLFEVCWEEERFDLILSNPPYLVEGDPAIWPEVRDYDPPVSLYGGADGLDFYRRILGQAELWLKPGGHLLLEVGAGQAEPVLRMIREGTLLEEAETVPDHAGIDRVVMARMPVQDSDPSIPLPNAASADAASTDAASADAASAGPTTGREA